MNRSITLSLTLAVALASQVALGGCTKKEDVATPPVDSTASAPTDGMGAASAADAASAAASAASDAAMAASR